MDDDDDEEACPLCMQNFDDTDIAFFACPCNYQVCLFCVHYIMEQMNGKCPACRQDYEEAKFRYDPSIAKKAREKHDKKKNSGGGGHKDKAGSQAPSAGHAGNSSQHGHGNNNNHYATNNTSNSNYNSHNSHNSQNKKEEKWRDGDEKELRRRHAEQLKQRKGHGGKGDLSEVRIVQENVVHVIGLTPNIAKAEVLKRNEFFGQYGKLSRVTVSRVPSQAKIAGATSTVYSAYLCFEKAEDAQVAIQAVDGFEVDGQILRANFGTTKYCKKFLDGEKCDRRDCIFLHKYVDQHDQQHCQTAWPEKGASTGGEGKEGKEGKKGRKSGGGKGDYGKKGGDSSYGSRYQQYSYNSDRGRKGAADFEEEHPKGSQEEVQDEEVQRAATTANAAREVDDNAPAETESSEAKPLDDDRNGAKAAPHDKGIAAATASEQQLSASASPAPPAADGVATTSETSLSAAAPMAKEPPRENADMLPPGLLSSMGATKTSQEPASPPPQQTPSFLPPSSPPPMPPPSIPQAAVSKAVPASAPPVAPPTGRPVVAPSVPMPQGPPPSGAPTLPPMPLSAPPSERPPPLLSPAGGTGSGSVSDIAGLTPPPRLPPEGAALGEKSAPLADVSPPLPPPPPCGPPSEPPSQPPIQPPSHPPTQPPRLPPSQPPATGPMSTSPKSPAPSQPPLQPPGKPPGGAAAGSSNNVKPPPSMDASMRLGPDVLLPAECPSSATAPPPGPPLLPETPPLAAVAATTPDDKQPGCAQPLLSSSPLMAPQSPPVNPLEPPGDGAFLSTALPMNSLGRAHSAASCPPPLGAPSLDAARQLAALQESAFQTPHPGALAGGMNDWYAYGKGAAVAAAAAAAAGKGKRGLYGDGDLPPPCPFPPGHPYEAAAAAAAAAAYNGGCKPPPPPHALLGRDGYAAGPLGQQDAALAALLRGGGLPPTSWGPDYAGLPGMPPGSIGREGGKDAAASAAAAAALLREEERMLALASLLQQQQQQRDDLRGPPLPPLGPPDGGLEFLQSLFPNTRVSVQPPATQAAAAAAAAAAGGGMPGSSSRSGQGNPRSQRGGPPGPPLSYSGPAGCAGAQAPLRPGPVDSSAPLGGAVDGKMWTPSLRDPSALALHEAQYGLSPENQQLLAAMAAQQRQLAAANQSAANQQLLAAMAAQQRQLAAANQSSAMAAAGAGSSKGDKRGGQKRGKG